MIKYSITKISEVPGFAELSEKHWQEFNNKSPNFSELYLQFMDVVVAKEGDTLIAYCFFKCFEDPHDEGNTCQVDAFYLDPEYRGRGIGKEMFSIVELEAKKDGCTRIKASYNNKMVLEDFFAGLGYKKTHIAVMKEI